MGSPSPDGDSAGGGGDLPTDGRTSSSEMFDCLTMACVQSPWMHFARESCDFSRISVAEHRELMIRLLQLLLLLLLLLFLLLAVAVAVAAAVMPLEFALSSWCALRGADVATSSSKQKSLKFAVSLCCVLQEEFRMMSSMLKLKGEICEDSMSLGEEALGCGLTCEAREASSEEEFVDLVNAVLEASGGEYADNEGDLR